MRAPLSKLQRGSWRCVGLLLLLLPALAVAAPRVAIVPIRGDVGGRLLRQLTESLCHPFVCVPASRILEGHAVRWPKARHAHVAAVFTGALKPTARGRALVLELAKGAQPRVKTWTLLVRDGKLSPVALNQVVDETRQTFGSAAAPAAAAPPPAVVEAPPAAPSEPPASATVQPPAPEPSPRVAATPSAQPVSSVPEAGSTEIPLAAVELGVDGFGRSLTYQGLTTGNLRTYSAPFLAALAARAELYPLHAAHVGVLAGLGLVADLSYAAGYNTREQCSAGATCTGDAFLPHPTTFSRLDVALVWRLPLGAAVVLTPEVGYRLGAYTVGADAQGRPFSNFPNVSDDGFKVGAGLELHLGERVRLLAHADVLPSISGGELLGPSFFPHGSAWGVDGALGLGVVLVGALEVRLWADATEYLYRFQTSPTDMSVATGAQDLSLGGRLTLRYAF